MFKQLTYLFESITSMSQPRSLLRVTLSLSLVLLTSGSLPVHADWWGSKKDTNGPALKTDDTPVSTPGAPSFVSFAPVVKKVSPSVVSIFTTKQVHPSSNHSSPMLNDPFFRHFFGDPDSGDAAPESRSRPQRRLPDQTQTGLGSGVIVSKDGFILTNSHVIEVADEIKVELSNSRKRYTAKLVGQDPSTDVALIKIEASDLTPMVIADSDKAEVGDVVLAIGTPFGLAQTVTMGIISAKGRTVGIENYEDFIQTDAAINPGNSGGALIDAQGRMIGLNTAIYGGGGGGNLGIGFAVPSNLARYVMESLLKEGHVSRGYLGVKISEVTSDLAEAFKLPEITGALVEEVTKGTAADLAGIQNGDIILEFNGKKIPDSSTLRLTVGQTRPNTECKVKLWRDGKELAVSVTLKELTPDVQNAAKKDSEDGDAVTPEAPASKSLIEGVKIDELTPETRRQFGVPPAIKGVAIVDVDPDSAVGKPGGPSLNPGDIITEIKSNSQTHAITSVKEALAAMKDAHGKTLLRLWNKGNLKEGTYRYFVLP